MKRSAFTLIELLVVVAIIVALLAILLPSMGKAIELSEDAVCTAHIGQMGKAMLGYVADNRKFSNWRDTIYGNYNQPKQVLQHSAVFPYVPSYEIWVCPRFVGVAPNPAGITRTYVTNWNCGAGSQYDSEQVTTVGAVFNTAGFSMFAEENAWIHPAYARHAINDGELVAPDWPNRDTLGTFHRPSASRYGEGNPWGYDPVSDADVQLNTGVSNVVFVDGHVEFVGTLQTIKVCRNDPAKIQANQKN